MRRHIYSIVFILLFKISGFAQSYGLTFNSHEVVLEKRTSLDLSPEDSLCFAKNFELKFDMSFLSGHQIYFGYVLRIVSTDNQNIDLIFNQKTGAFKVIAGENFSGINFTADSPRIYKEWSHFDFKFDLEKHVLQVLVNGKAIGKGNLPVTSNCFKFLWGANDFQKFKTRDIPPMRIKDIKIYEKDELKYSWPLDETSGDICYDKISKRIAKVKNPEWLKPKYQKWALLDSFIVGGYSSVAYNAKDDKLYLVGSDSLAVYSLSTDRHALEWLPSRKQNLLMGNQAIYDTLTNKLYDVFIDGHKVSSFEFNRRQWDLEFPDAPATEFWQANKFISSADSSLYIVGGYGQLKYKNLVQRYRFDTKKWEVLKLTGDFFPPRYLSGLGTDPEGKFAYVIGGYGSQTGDQELDPRYYYDLFRYNVKEGSFKKLYSLKPLSTPFTFGGSLVIGPKPGAYYGLMFPNDSYNSHLQLIEGSLTDSTFQPLGDPIPYSFHDIQSFAYLYYSPKSNKLIAVTLFYLTIDGKEKNTEVKIWTLDFPPEPPGVAVQAGTGEAHRSRYLFVFSLLSIACVAVFFFFRKGAGKATPSAAAAIPPVPIQAEAEHITPTTGRDEHLPIHSSIYLFGQFQVFDKEGHDITRLFTPLLKELFLVIATYTISNGRGISSEGLNEILWHDKSEKDAKNNRSVNLAKLKTFLEKIGNCVINKESGYWQFQILDEEIYVDYKKYVSLLQASAADPTQAYIHPMIDIIRRGPFLSQTEYNWLDDIKSDISNSGIHTCLGYLESPNIQKDPEFVIEIANCIFYFDQLNEDALIHKCKSLVLLKRHTLANNTYQKFLKDYKDIYGTEFEKSFQDVIS
ncbi:MAG TPA: hypothetical protein VK563_18945 [Puia sp.]|nr:hypothetical protein [Puia sp.]